MQLKELIIVHWIMISFRASIFVLSCFAIVIHESHSITYPMYSRDQSRRLNPPAYSQNGINNNNGPMNKYNYMPIDRDASITGLQPPGSSSSLTLMNAPSGPMVPYQTGSGDMTTMSPTTSTEDPIVADMQPDKIKFNLPAVLVVFVVFIGVVATLFLRITWLHALLVAGNKTSIQINARNTLWGNNNVKANRPNGIAANKVKPLSNINSYFTRSFVHEDSFFEDAWDLTIRILNAISKVSDKWALEEFETEKNRMKKLR